MPTWNSKLNLSVAKIASSYQKNSCYLLDRYTCILNSCQDPVWITFKSTAYDNQAIQNDLQKLEKHGELGSMINAPAKSKGFPSWGPLCLLPSLPSGQDFYHLWVFLVTELFVCQPPPISLHCWGAGAPRQDTSASLCPAGSTSVFILVGIMSAYAKSSAAFRSLAPKNRNKSNQPNILSSVCRRSWKRAP